MTPRDIQYRHTLGRIVSMFANYFLTAFRHLVKDKFHSAINIAGLSVGLAVALLIGLWIADEFSYNKNFAHYDRIAQLYTNATMNGEVFTGISVPLPLADELRTHYGSNFRHVVMSAWTGGHVLMVEGNKVVNYTGTYMESEAPDMLSLHMLKGSRDGLKQGSAILLSQSVAAALFGNADPIGRIVKVDNQVNLTVTGVYTDLPKNSSFGDLNFIGDWQSYYSVGPGLNKEDDPWRNNSWLLYTEIMPNTNMATVSARIRDAKRLNVTEKEKSYHYALLLQPMSRWNLFSEYKNGVNVGGRIQYVWLFGIIGVFVLLLACINFMNLSTARSERRAREVGIRKAIGGLRRHLIYQFFTESLMLTLFAFCVGLLVVQLSLSPFNQLADKSLVIPWGSSLFWILCLAFCALTGLVAGSYPALYLSSFQPIKVLKGSFKVGRLASLPRKVLVVLQFTVSVSLIIGTIVVFRQVQYARDRPTGYDKDGLVEVPRATRDLDRHFDAVRAELKGAGVIEEMAEADGPVTGVWGTNNGFDWQGKDPNLQVEFPNTGVSPTYGKTVGWQFIAGRDFSTAYARDTVAFVINETAAKLMGMKDPVGRIIKWDGEPFTVIGVIKDMLMESPYAAVRPSVYCMARSHHDIVTLRFPKGANMHAALDKCKTVFAKYSPAEPFAYSFVDEDYAKKFGDEERIGNLAAVFAVLAISISCLGLFGMASFMAEQRTREIGVRKVLGANVVNLWAMLSKDFIVLVGLSLLIAIPLSLWLMHNWLANYQYRSDLAWWIFAAAGAGALVITLLTVSWQALRAAMANPIKSLRTE